MRRRPNRFFSRRQFLAGLGVSAAAAPFVPLLESAAGGPEAPPKRFVVFFHPHGVMREDWLPTGSETSFTLPSILAPLSSVKSQICVLDGLAVKPTGIFGGPHTVGPPWVFTASPMLEGNDFDHGCCPPHGWNSAASIDQVIAEHIGNDTPFKSIELGVAPGGNHPGSRISYAGPSQPLEPVSDPQQLFDWQFADSSADDAAVALRKQQRLSVLNAVKPELDALQSKVNTDDRLKIEKHLSMLSKMEAQLQSTHVCAPPDIGEAVDIDNRANDGIVSRQQLDMLVALLACGRTNVASIMYRRAENDAFSYPFVGVDVEHHISSHAVKEDPVWNDLRTIYEFYGGEVAYLAEQMASIIEPDGSTLLDNTVILWASEISRGRDHSFENMPFVLVGGGGGAIKTGRFLQYPGQNHCRLMVSLCNAFGMDTQTFGGFDDGSGPLSGLLV